MVKNEWVCSSCKTKISNLRGSVAFKCPKCSEEEIIRCLHCREIAVRYTCSKCGFSGPN